MNDLNIKEAYGLYFSIRFIFGFVFFHIYYHFLNLILIYYILCVFVISNKLFLNIDFKLINDYMYFMAEKSFYVWSPNFSL